jgi:hypothetical protein
MRLSSASLGRNVYYNDATGRTPVRIQFDAATGRTPVRIQFDATHSTRANEVDHFEVVDGETVRTHTTYTPAHAHHGKVCYFERGRHVRTEFAPEHPKAGAIERFDPESGVKVRIEFAASHRSHGQVVHLVAGKRVERVEFEPQHRSHGELHVYDACERITRWPRIEFAPRHPRHGEVRYFTADGGRRRTEFASTHARCGEVDHHDPTTGAVVSTERSPARRLADAGLGAWVEPDELMCPITLEVFDEPMVASDGHTYERRALLRLLETSKPVSPLTRVPLDPAVMVPNRTLAKRLRSYVDTTLAIAAEGAKRARTA